MRGSVGVLWLVVALLLGGATTCPAAPLLQTDFNGPSDGWVRNRNAHIAIIGEPPRNQVLRLTADRVNQVGVVWTEMRRRVPSFSLLAEARITFGSSPSNPCPADGLVLAFAPVETDAIGAAGGSLGLLGNERLIRQFIAMELNTWYGQGLGDAAEKTNCTFGKHVTFAFDVVTPTMQRTESARTAGGGTPAGGGYKIGQTTPPEGMNIVNGGWYRYQWNVAADGTMTLFVTGLDASNQQFQRVKVLEVKLATNPLDYFDGRWGLTATTGGAFQTVDVSRVTIESPMVTPQ